MKIKALPLIISLAIPLAIGGAGAFATQSSVDYWYTLLNKPAFNPPNYIFAPVWTLLYILMGISLYRIWQSQPSTGRTKSLALFALQMTLNFAWSFVFFYFRLIHPALIEIMFLWLSIAAFIAVAYKTDRPAALLQIPYILWVTFATALNWGIYTLN